MQIRQTFSFGSTMIEEVDWGSWKENWEVFRNEDNEDGKIPTGQVNFGMRSVRRIRSRGTPRAFPIDIRTFPTPIYPSATIWDALCILWLQKQK